MNDYSHLRKAGSEDDEVSLIEEPTAQAGGAPECLEKMKEISELISKVTILTLCRIF